LTRVILLTAEVDDGDHRQRVTYSREGAGFTFEVEKHRLEIAFGRKSGLELLTLRSSFSPALVV
jgi:hypothetical protein